MTDVAQPSDHGFSGAGAFPQQVAQDHEPTQSDDDQSFHAGEGSA